VKRSLARWNTVFADCLWDSETDEGHIGPWIGILVNGLMDCTWKIGLLINIASEHNDMHKLM